MTEWTIEVLWQCSVCERRGNRGLKDRYCTNCGHKKDASDGEYMPKDTSEVAALSGDDDDRARAGADRVCQYCDSLQSRLNKCCGNCGASDVEPTRSATEEPRACTSDEPVASDAFAAPRMRSWWPKLVVGAAVASLTWLGYWLFAPRVVDAVVTGMYWKHEVAIQRWQVNAHDGFDPEGAAFDVTPVGMRHHHYDHVHVGSHREPYRESYTCGQSCYTTPRTRSCRSNSNGTATCSSGGGDRVCHDKACYRTAYRTVQDYADVSRQRMYYTWRSWGWRYNRSVTKEGRSIETFWPSDAELKPSTIADGEREQSERKESYQVVFGYDDERVNINPSTEVEFKRYQVHQRRKLKVNRAGSVEVLP